MGMKRLSRKDFYESVFLDGIMTYIFHLNVFIVFGLKTFILNTFVLNKLFKTSLIVTKLYTKRRKHISVPESQNYSNFSESPVTLDITDSVLDTFQHFQSRI